MKKTIIYPILCLFMFLNSIGIKSQNNAFSGNYEFDIEYLNTELDGSVTLKVWGNGRNRFDAVDQAKKNAVYAILFYGIRGNTPQSTLPPLITEVNAFDKYANYFNTFFSDKKSLYKKFVTIRDERIGKTIFRKRLTNTGGVSYGVIVRLLRSELREELIKTNIIFK